MTELQKSERLDTVRELVALTFGVDEARVNATTVQDDLEEWDSVGHLNLMLAVEDEFGVRLEVDDMTRLTSVRSLLAHLEE